jgi:hypothetical protein
MHGLLEILSIIWFFSRVSLNLKNTKAPLEAKVDLKSRVQIGYIWKK